MTIKTSNHRQTNNNQQTSKEKLKDVISKYSTSILAALILLASFALTASSSALI